MSYTSQSGPPYTMTEFGCKNANGDTVDATMCASSTSGESSGSGLFGSGASLSDILGFGGKLLGAFGKGGQQAAPPPATIQPSGGMGTTTIILLVGGAIGAIYLLKKKK